MASKSLIETFPFEIISLIVDMIANENEDRHASLKSSSLTCRAFGSLCQPHIFRSIRLASEWSSPSRISNNFARLISSNPGVGYHIRELRLVRFPLAQFHPPTLLSAAIDFLTQLDTLVLWPYSTLDWEKSSPNLRSTLLRLIHLPTIISLKLIDTGAFALSNLIPCPNLRHLHLKGVDVSEALGTSLPIKSIRPRELGLGSFSLRHSATFRTAISKVGSAEGKPLLDLGNLTNLILQNDGEAISVASNISKYAHRLENVHFWITYKTLYTGVVASIIPVASVSTLRSLEFSVFSGHPTLNPLRKLWPIFHGLGGHDNIKTIKIYLSILSPPPVDSCSDNEWDMLETIFLGPGWPELERVDLDIIVVPSFQKESMVLHTLADMRQLLITRFLGLRKSLDFRYSVRREGNNDEI